MGLMNYMKTKMQSWLEINPPIAMTINIQEWLDFNGNAIKNRIWYRGDPNEIEQLYWQLPQHEVDKTKFWASRPTPGLQMRKIHTGLPATMVDLIAGIIVANLNDFEFDGSDVVREVWEDHIVPENDFKHLIYYSIAGTCVVGDGAYKISIDPTMSKYPIIEFWTGENVVFKYKRGRIQKVIFKSYHEYNGQTVELREVYGHGYIRYETFIGDNPIEMPLDGEFEGLVNVEWDGDDMMAVPVKFWSSNKFEGRGRSLFDKKIDAFDSFDEAYSQWIDALRAGRTKEYIPESLIPRDPNTGKVLKPNPFDNRYIKTDADMRERADNRITSTSAEIKHDSYMATYATALDLCLQGIMSPSTLGVDVKKLDNAEAQREKEKVTLYTRDAIIEALQPALEKLVEATINAYYRSIEAVVPDYTCTVTWQDYANPSFESQIETIGKGKQSGILSIEACVEELYGDSRDDEWKAEEVRRLKAEQGITEMEEPMVASEVWNDYQNREQLLPNANQRSEGLA
jgi:hypothetical protein